MTDDRQTRLTTGEALASAVGVFTRGGMSEPRRTAQSLLAAATGRDRTHLVVHDDAPLAAEELGRFRGFVRRRAAGEPVQYITGRQEFFGLEFEVTPAVLIPRPETELVVEAGLELLDGGAAERFCDVGTGSGCIAVALLRARPRASAVALDISPAALAVARRNAARHGVSGRVAFVASDLFSGLREGGARSRLVVSNPPYVAEDELPTLQPEVRDHEPRQALTPGGDGLAVVRRLLADAPRRLVPRGHLVFEIGYGQERAVRAFVDRGVWEVVRVSADLQGIPRVFVLRLRA